MGPEALYRRLRRDACETWVRYGPDCSKRVFLDCPGRERADARARIRVAIAEAMESGAQLYFSREGEDATVAFDDVHFELRGAGALARAAAADLLRS